MVHIITTGYKTIPTLLARPRSLRLLPLPKDQVGALCVGRKCESKNGGDPQQP